MTTRKLETLVSGLKFGEGPRWRDDKLWYSDFYAHRVSTVDLAGNVEAVATVENRPSGLGFMPDGSLLIVSMLDRKVLKLANGSLTTHADLSGLIAAPCNDMVVDGEGRAYVGNFGFDRHRGEAPKSTLLVMVEPDGNVKVVADELMFPNGAVITPDGRTMILAETFGDRLTAFDIAPDGSLSNRRLFAEIKGLYPDGICLDAEGAVWVTSPRMRKVLRILDGGKVAEEIVPENRGAYACMLGGPERRTLFVVTNVDSGPGVADKDAGRIEVTEVDVPGAGLP